MDWIKQLFGASRNLSLAVKVDHVELTSTHLVIGLAIGWRNRTPEPIPVKEVRVAVYINGKSEEPLRFYPLERFARVIGHRAIQKSPVGPFTLPSNEVYSEQMRFISQEILDIPPGSYTVDVELKDTDDASYVNRIKIDLDQKLKYRRSKEWGGEGQDV